MEKDEWRYIWINLWVVERAMDLGISWLFWMTRNKYTELEVGQQDVRHGCLPVPKEKQNVSPNTFHRNIES